MQPTLTTEEQMILLEGDLNHLMDVQNRQEPELDNYGYPIADHLTEEIGRLEKIWGQLYDNFHKSKAE